LALNFKTDDQAAWVERKLEVKVDTATSASRGRWFIEAKSVIGNKTVKGEKLEIGVRGEEAQKLDLEAGLACA
jgi:hypothetical protein